ncbi:hypothetical protein FACS1894139_10240 [Planctomycetales bacterium]|nr:hypothetical protein FACS1894108_04760 [Planctomycetales bacterium]GHT05785.1 hypothetical protein FACS1894139_10240 [Planctomycetales bacterium]
MKLAKLLEWVRHKERFATIDDYSAFGEEYLSFIFANLQAVIVAQNETQYRFFQYKEDGNFNVTRPLNSNLLISRDNFSAVKDDFNYALKHIKDIREKPEARANLNKFIYTCQQAIGATLDALPAGESNIARKRNGDLFERYIRLMVSALGIEVRTGTVAMPVVVNNEELFPMTYQHDLIIEQGKQLKAIGSVKTSSKDRLSKIFMDKFMYNRLTDSQTPHFAVFLHDVQRKGKAPKFGVNTTFLTGHFKGYTIKLNPLDGVYYCDMRPVMRSAKIVGEQIKTLDCLLVEDIWNFL